MPVEVVNRLDAVLGELAAWRTDPRASAAADTGGTDELGRRRRRRWPAALAAAAAIPALAVGGPQVLRSLTSGTGSADRTSAGGSAAAPRSAGGAAAAPQGSPSATGRGLASGTLPPPVLRSGFLRQDVRRVVRGGAAALETTPSHRTATQGCA